MGADQFAGLRQAEGMGGWGGSYNAEVQAMIIEGYWHPGETTVQAPEVAKEQGDLGAGHMARRARRSRSPAATPSPSSRTRSTAGRLPAGRVLQPGPPLDTPFKEVGWIVGKKPSWRRSTPTPTLAWTSTSTTPTMPPTGSRCAAPRCTASLDPAPGSPRDGIPWQDDPGGGRRGAAEARRNRVEEPGPAELRPFAPSQISVPADPVRGCTSAGCQGGVGHPCYLWAVQSLEVKQLAVPPHARGA